MHAFCGQFVAIVQACHVRLENYEVFLLQAQITSTCCSGIELCSCNQFPLYVKFDSLFFHGPNILAECCGVFSVYVFEAWDVADKDKQKTYSTLTQHLEERADNRVGSRNRFIDRRVYELSRHYPNVTAPYGSSTFPTRVSNGLPLHICTHTHA